MKKILIQYSNGKEELKDVPDGAKFHTAATILWDEREQGAIPKAKLDEYNAKKEAEHQAATAEEDKRKKDTQDRRARLKNVAAANTLPELKALMADIVAELGL